MPEKENPKFISVQEEALYWRTRYDEKVKELEEVEENFNEQFEDFQQSSKELESEMERELQLNEKKLKDLTSQYHRIKNEYEDSQDKSRRSTEDTNKMLHSLQDEVETLRKTTGELRREKRLLEQENDELETRVRVSEASLHDLSEKLNKTLEENAWLQTELEEKATRNQETVQRLKEEIKDLQSEIAALAQKLSETTPTHIERDTKPSPPNGAPSNTNGTSQVRSTGILSKARGKEGSIDLVDDILSLVKDMEKKLQKQDEKSTFETEDYIKFAK